MKKEFTSVELFAGAGGLAIGLEKAGLKNILLNEVDKDCVATLKKNRPNWNIVHEDVRKVDFSFLKEKVDVVTGGFPCQAFSHAGKRLGFEDIRGTLFYEFARAIKEIQPKIFWGENVSGLVNHDNGKTLNVMIEILKSLGYNVQYKVLDAAKFSVPQKRKRIIIIGTRPGISFEYPEEHKRIVVLRDALQDVPKSLGTKYSEKRKKVMELVPQGGSWINLPLNVQKEFMGKSLFSGGGKRGMARRISWDEPCLTLTTSPSQKQTERCHPEETRPFTIREYARIQTFPDNWEFIGSVSSQYKQIGNAVPVKLAEEVGKQIIEALSNETQPQKIQQVFSYHLSEPQSVAQELLQ